MTGIWRQIGVKTNRRRPSTSLLAALRRRLCDAERPACYLVIRRHPRGGYAIVVDDGHTVPEPTTPAYRNPVAAALALPRGEGESLDVRIHPECL